MVQMLSNKHVKEVHSKQLSTGEGATTSRGEAGSSNKKSKVAKKKAREQRNWRRDGTD